MPSYKLTYFGPGGRAEPLRVIFAEAKVPFEDQYTAEFPELKRAGKLPFGQLPILEIDGVTYAQTNALARFLARRFGLAGSTDLEQLVADQAAEGMVDLNAKAQQIQQVAEERKSELREKFARDVLPVWLAYLDTLLARHEDGHYYFAGKTFTYADILFLTTINTLEFTYKYDNVLSAYPLLHALRQRVAQRPNIAAYLASSKF